MLVMSPTAFVGARITESFPLAARLSGMRGLWMHDLIYGTKEVSNEMRGFVDGGEGVPNGPVDERG